MDSDSITDPVLGELRWDSRVKWWAGRFSIGSSQPFQLYIPSRTPDRSISAEARQALTRLAGDDSAIRRRAADGLLEILNSTWNDGEPISADEFMRRMSPDSIVVYERGRADVSYHDDDMFLGHAISVRIAPDGTFIESLIEG
jgi:hypothetical protein